MEEEPLPNGEEAIQVTVTPGQLQHAMPVETQRMTYAGSDRFRRDSKDRLSRIRESLRRSVSRVSSTMHVHGRSGLSTKKFSSLVFNADDSAAGGVSMTYSELVRDDIFYTINSISRGRKAAPVASELPVVGRKFELTTRDIHTLDPTINLHGPSFEVRRGSILINLDPIKAIVTSSKMIVFLQSFETGTGEAKNSFQLMARKSFGGKNLELAKQLVEKRSMVSGPFQITSSSLGIDDPSSHFLPSNVGGSDTLRKLLGTDLKEKLSDIISSGERSGFELVAIEALLTSFCDFVNHEFDDLKPSVLELCDRASKKRNAEVELVDLLRRCKSTLNAHKVKIQDSISAFDEILKDVDALNLMQLTKYAKYPQKYKPGDNYIEYEEVELLFDSYLQALETSLSNVEILLHDVDAVYELLMFNLDHSRNQLLRVEIVFSAITTCASMSAVIVGGFGMNLKSDAEELPHYFWGILSGAFIFVPLGSIVILTYLWRVGVFGALAE